MITLGIRSIYNISNTNQMMSTLGKIREENGTLERSRTYYSIIRTGQLIPYDSAIFLSTDVLPFDTEHEQSASMILLKKRIRVSVNFSIVYQLSQNLHNSLTQLYLIIFDEHHRTDNSTNVKTMIKNTGRIGQLALKSGGDIIYVPDNAFRSADGEMGLVNY